MHSSHHIDLVSHAFIEGLVEVRHPFKLLHAPELARAAFLDLQSIPVGRPHVDAEDAALPVGPGDAVPVRIFRPVDGPIPLPVVMYFHGGGWMLGDVETHDRLAREIAAGAHAAVVFVRMGRAPEVRFPGPLEEAYAATRYVAEHGARHNLDGSRLAVAGDGTGGNIAAAVTHMAKERRAPHISFQILFYPVTDADFDSPSYFAFRDGPWLSMDAMKLFWDAYVPDVASRAMVTACPLKATLDQLKRLPDALIITAENDVVRDEGEAYARKLCEARVRVVAARYLGTMHDFLTLNALADTPATRGALRQVISELKVALE